MQKQQIGDRVIDGDCEGQVVNVYDTDGGPVVVVRWDGTPTSGLISVTTIHIVRTSRLRTSIRVAKTAGA